MSRRGWIAVGVLLTGAGLGVARPSRSQAPVPASSVGLPTSFSEIQASPDGGTVWQGLIPDPSVPAMHRPTVVYLPPSFERATAYRTVVLLHGFRGSPFSVVNGLDLRTFADSAIADGELPPFLAVIPPAGVSSHYDGEWAGPWEDYVVQHVLPWARTHLPTARAPSDWALAGLSAGGYGAVDIGLRHPSLFGTLESWSGSFTAPHDGPLRHASKAVLGGHDPTLLVQQEAPLLRRRGTRFFVSVGKHDPAAYRDALAFAQLLTRLHLSHQLWLGSGGHNGKLWRAQLPAALAYALDTAA